MSIIYEALKKTQKHIEQNKVTLANTKVILPAKKRWWAVGGLSTTFIALCLVSYYLPGKPVADTRPLIVAEAPIGKMQLTGVFVSDAEKIAVINDRMVHEGDMVGTMRVIRIDIESVALQRGHKVIELRRAV